MDKYSIIFSSFTLISKEGINLQAYLALPEKLFIEKFYLNSILNVHKDLW